MNKRLIKKNEKRRRSELHRILDLVLDINGMETRKKEVTGSLPTAFFSFSGHTASIDLRVYRTGWDPDLTPEINEYAYLDARTRLHASDLVRLMEEEKHALPL